MHLPPGLGWTLSALLLGAAIAVPAGAADSAMPPARRDDPAITLDRVTVTGTNIANSADALDVPMMAFGARELAETGLDANLLEIVRKRLPAFSGSNNLGNSNANVSALSTAGGSQLALRNLDTLVLINGRRVAASGANARGGNNFVDLNQFPLAAIERVEVVPAGASATYGSDAIGGVVNVILKSEYEGAEFGARYAVAPSAGNYTERSYHSTVGLARPGFHVLVTGSSAKTDRLLQADRPFSRSISGRNATIAGAIGEGPAFPRYFLNPALNSPAERNPVGAAARAPNLAALVTNGTYLDLGATAFTAIANTFEQAPYTTLLLGQEQTSLALATNATLLAGRVVLFGDVLSTHSVGTSQLPAMGTTPTVTVPDGAPFNPVAGVVPQVAFRYLPYTRPFTNRARLDRGVIGGRVALGRGWTAEVAGNWNTNGTTLQVRNVFYGPNLQRAIAGGYDAQGRPVAGGGYSRLLAGYSETSTTVVIQPALDPFARAPAVNPAALDNVYGTYVGGTATRLSSYDAALHGRIAAGGLGEVKVAAGAEWREETLSARPDENARLTGPTAGRWLAVPLFDPFAQTRRITAGFAEARVRIAGPDRRLPAAHGLELGAAYRAEEYSDAGPAHVPKFGVRWQPVDAQVTLRGSYSEGFTAPPLFAMFGPVTRAFTPAAIVPNVFGVAGQAQVETGANSALHPARARIRSAGVTVAPRAVKGLTLSVDVVDTFQRDLIGSVGVTTILQSVEQLGPQSPYAGQVSFLDFPRERGAQFVTRPGELGSFLRAGNSAYGLFVADTRTNLAGQRVTATDVNLDYVRPMGTNSEWRLSATATIFSRYQFQALPTQPYFEYAGHATNGGTGSQGTLPRYRTYAVLAWRRGGLTLSAANTFVPAVTDLGPGGVAFATSTTLRPMPVASYSACDLAATYRLSTGRHPRLLAHGAGLALTFGVNNVGNRMPPLAPQAFNESNVDLAGYSVVGRLLFAQATMRF